MKRAITIFLLIIIFLIIYLLQSNLFSWFNIAGVRPNLFVVFILIIGLFLGESKGITLGIILGIVLDFFISKSVGISGIMFAVIGIIGGVLDKNFSKDSRITMIIMIVMCTCLYEIGSYIFNYFVNDANIEILIFTKKLIIENLFNIILTIILYPIIIKLGYKSEKVYREDKILTRYF